MKRGYYTSLWQKIFGCLKKPKRGVLNALTDAIMFKSVDTVNITDLVLLIDIERYFGGWF